MAPMPPDRWPNALRFLDRRRGFPRINALEYPFSWLFASAVFKMRLPAPDTAHRPAGGPTTPHLHPGRPPVGPPGPPGAQTP